MSWTRGPGCSWGSEWGDPKLRHMSSGGVVLKHVPSDGAGRGSGSTPKTLAQVAALHGVQAHVLGISF